MARVSAQLDVDGVPFGNTFHRPEKFQAEENLDSYPAVRLVEPDGTDTFTICGISMNSLRRPVRSIPALLCTIGYYNALWKFNEAQSASLILIRVGAVWLGAEV